jgi:Helix-turn-helix domain
MASPRPNSPVRRRRPTAWREYQIDHSEPLVCAPPSREWPTTPAHAALAPGLSTPTPSGGKLCSQADLADRFGVSIATVASWRKKGLLAGHLVGGQWRFTEQQVADFLRRTEQPLRLYGKRTNDDDDLFDVS